RNGGNGEKVRRCQAVTAGGRETMSRGGPPFRNPCPLPRQPLPQTTSPSRTPLRRTRVKTPLVCLAVLFALAVGPLSGHTGPANPGISFPRFRVQEIETTLKVGYAVLLADLNGDGKTDIIVVDTTRVVWYENPTWKRRPIIEGQTKPDNVCIAAHD